MRFIFIPILFQLILLTYSDVKGQPDTLRFTSGFKEIQANSFFAYFNVQHEIALDSALNVFAHLSSKVKPFNKFNLGSINGYYWFRTIIKNESTESLNLYLEIPQPHIYRINFYQMESGDVTLHYETGIKYNFFKRPLHHRFFEFPILIKAGESATIVLQVYHLNSLCLPINFRTQLSVHESDYKQNLIWGYWIGFLSFCSLFALVASLLLRKNVFLWYFLYMLSAAVYGFTEQGFGFQFIFPSMEDIEALVIIQLAVYNFIFLIRFSQGLLEIKKYLPKVDGVLNGIFYFLLCMLVAGVLLQKLMFQLSPIVLPLVNIATILGLVLLAYSGVKALSNNRMVAIFFLAAYFTLVCSAIFMILNIGFGVTQYFGPNPVLISYFLEAVILSVALVILFKQVSTERTRLLEKVNIQQKEMYQQYVNGIEIERSRIAGELHDNVGSRLSYFRKLLEFGNENLERINQIDLLIKDIRQLSHDLAPPMAQGSELIPLLEKIVMETRHASGLNIKFQQHNYREVFQPIQILQVYRIVQEILANVVKHSQATQVDMQVFGYENEVNLTVEDNGKGFDYKIMTDGIGLNQIKIRAENLNARLEINSHPGTGTLILLQIPIDTRL